MSSPLSVERLTKRYGSVTAVEELSFSVRRGLVTGLVGPNGSGKSTTIRAALGLITPTAGEVLVDGAVYRSLDRPLTRVGTVLDANAVNGAMTGRRHLRWMAASNRIADRRVDELLDQVGLRDVARRRISGYSLGMKQRLGIAAALLGDPPLLVFDEPMNGLDPEGIVWLRGFLRDRVGEGRTVLLSSHLMGELEGVADRLVIIKRGRLVADTTVADLLQRSTPGVVSVRTRDAAGAMTVLANGGASVTSAGRDTIEVDGLAAEQVVRLLAGAGVGFDGVTNGRASLESMYLEAHPMNIAPHTLRAEVRKTFATRGTWMAYALLAAVTVGFSMFISAGSTTDAGAFPGGGDNDIVADALSGASIGVIVAAVIGAVSIGTEYASGIIASTFAAQPRRSRVLAAKAIIVGVCTTSVGVAAAFAAYFASRPIQRENGFVAPGYPDPDLTSEPVLRAILGSGALCGLIGLLALGVGMIVKRTSITIPLVIALVLVPALLAVDESAARKVQSWTPLAGFSIQHTVDRADYYTDPWAGLAVAAMYAVSALAIGVAVTRRRDV